jgi:hypothetical protein
VATKKTKPSKASKATTKKPSTARAKKKRATPAKAAPAKTWGSRSDLGAPIDGFFERQPAHLRAVLEELRKLVEAAAPDAAASLKWGMPFYCIDGRMTCALAGFQSHVSLVLAGPPAIFDDPEGRLEGDGRGSRHLKMRTIGELRRGEARKWIRAAVKHARAMAKEKR